MASAQEVYLNTNTAPTVRPESTWERMTNWLTGSYDSYFQDVMNQRLESNAQKLLTKAEWEREDSSYQRLVEDLKKAGINPYYALNQSSISPVGSSGQSAYKGRNAKDKSGENMKGLLATAILLMKLLS